MSDILVKAADGTRVPKEGKPRDYISDDPKGTPVPDTAYYRRLVRDTSLEIVPETKTRRPAAAKEEA